MEIKMTDDTRRIVSAYFAKRMKKSKENKEPEKMTETPEPASSAPATNGLEITGLSITNLVIAEILIRSIRFQESIKNLQNGRANDKRYEAQLRKELADLKAISAEIKDANLDRAYNTTIDRLEVYLGRYD